MKYVLTLNLLICTTFIFSQDSIQVNDCNYSSRKVFYSNSKSYITNENCTGLIEINSKNLIDLSFVDKKALKNVDDIFIRNDTLILLNSENNFLYLYNITNKKLVFKSSIPCGIMTIYDLVENCIYLGNTFSYTSQDCENAYSVGIFNIKTKDFKIKSMLPYLKSPSLTAIDNKMISYQNSKFYLVDFMNYKVLIFDNQFNTIDSLISYQSNLEIYKPFIDYEINFDFPKNEISSLYFREGHLFNHIVGISALMNDTLIIYRREKVLSNNKASELNAYQNPYISEKTNFRYELDFWVKKERNWELYETIKLKDGKQNYAFIFSNFNVTFNHSKSINFMKAHFSEIDKKRVFWLYKNFKI